MTSRGVTIAGFMALLGVALAAELLARARRIDLPRFGATVGHVMRRPSGRAAVLGVWFWLGWHFLAR